ncbi:oligopeptide transport system substrate-binding protein [Seinonella peptonophila]|uniref:Oligopeptide transport system substrate-binding protein n=1 Tax=Seinonella peptonophila TaxID=112248 RepID=A0A1M4XIF9_9BACL|nr:peptide ABC transporter substrate-binding protein [Seinonella peptonophila]SHE93181.1 oligopeptide transport system substrate-binding protein [Seinonella peptonophila]
MNKKRLLSVLAFVLICALLLASCGFEGNAIKPAGGDNRTFVLAESAEPPNLDVSKSTDEVSSRILNNTMEGLLRQDRNGRPQPAIAAQLPQVSKDKRTYTFTLRNARWSDGKPVRAQDFVFSWLRTLNAKTKSEYAFILFPIQNAEEYNAGKVSASQVGVKALDDSHLQVKLKFPTPYFMELCSFTTFMPQREDIVNQYGSEYALEANRLIFNGPFTLSNWEHEASFTLKKNSFYWDQRKVRLDRVEGKIIKDVASTVNLYSANRLDFTEINPEFAAIFEGKSDRTVIKEMASWYIEMNQTKAFFKNLNIRKSINYGIDKRSLTKRVLKNDSVPAGGLMPTHMKGDEKHKFRELSPDTVLYDPAKAKQLYAAGLKELGLKRQPDRLEIVGDDADSSKKQMEYIKEQLRKNLGLQVEVTAIPFKQRLQRGKRQQFDLLISGWNADYNDPMTFSDLFLSGGSYNRGKWSNPTYDQLVRKSMTNPNDQERLADLMKAEKILIQDAAIVPLYYRSRLGIKKPFVKGIYWISTGSSYVLKETYLDWKK